MRRTGATRGLHQLEAGSSDPADAGRPIRWRPGLQTRRTRDAPFVGGRVFRPGGHGTPHTLEAGSSDPADTRRRGQLRRSLDLVSDAEARNPLRHQVHVGRRPAMSARPPTYSKTVLSDVTTTYWMPGTLESRTRALIEGRTLSAADGRCVSMFGPHALTTRQPNTHAGIDDGDRRRTIMRHART